jgi:hypothetical protein
VSNNPLNAIDAKGLYRCAPGEYDGECEGVPAGSGGGAGAGGGGGGGWNPCGSYCAPPPEIIGQVPTLTSAYQQSLGVYLSCLSYNFQCDANGNYQDPTIYLPQYLQQGKHQYDRLSLNLAQFGGRASARNFTGQTKDVTAGLYDFLSRQQSSAQGSWLVPDPAGLAAVDPTNPQTGTKQWCSPTRRWSMHPRDGGTRS